MFAPLAVPLDHTLKDERNSAERLSLVGVPLKLPEGEESHHVKSQTQFPGKAFFI